MYYILILEERMVTITQKRNFLSRSLSSLNQNKVNGLAAERDLRDHISNLGFANRISVGGWIFRKAREQFGTDVVALFPEITGINTPFPQMNHPVPNGLHAVCASLHQSGIRSYFCRVSSHRDPDALEWRCLQLGIPENNNFISLDEVFANFNTRRRNYNFLRHNNEVNNLSDELINEEYLKESLRIAVQKQWFTQASDIDGVFWGERFSYPLEIKEKTVANNSNTGDYFGLDLGPFVKLTFFASKRGNLKSVFVVKEINNTTDRELVNWWFSTFENLAAFASWVPIGGGKNMGGGNSTVVSIPKSCFLELNAENLRSL